jgi:choline dehydrogenase
MSAVASEQYEYIVVGSGAGGGPLAANLAERGHRVLLIEAGSDPESYLYQVPCFHAYSTEEKAMAWDFFVHHYSENEARDDKYREARGGVFYPRAGTLGGCTAHNAMVTVYPHDSDWTHIAELTGDESWRPDKMRRYFERLEHCTYVDPPPRGGPNPSGHGFAGWLKVSKVDPRLAIGDKQILETVMDAAVQSLLAGAPKLGKRWFSALWKFIVSRIKRILKHLDTGFDPNDVRNAGTEGMSMLPLATGAGKRNGTREFIRKVQKMYPDRLIVRMNHLATRVLLDADQCAIGVECLEGQHLYRADPSVTDAPQFVKREYHCTREVILAGGAFNTPQLLMLSGIGPKEHLEEKGIECLVHRPGVGRNLQDRYEVGVVSTMEKDFEILTGATFTVPAEGEEGDPCFQQWLQGSGVYTTNGAVAAVIMRSKDERPEPDLFIFGMPGYFRGYYPGYSQDIERKRNYFTWAILKAHTNNTKGEVRLRSKDPRDTPDINFHYFDEGNDPNGEDLASVVNGVRFVRRMNAHNDGIAEEQVPGSSVPDEGLAKWVTDNAWGHHASCSCRMGRPDDPMAVVDSHFRVIGTKNLRIVDASVFPRVPGFFIVTPIYMISEKAADVIVADAAQAGCNETPESGTSQGSR